MTFLVVTLQQVHLFSQCNPSVTPTYKAFPSHYGLFHPVMRLFYPREPPPGGGEVRGGLRWV